MARPGSTTDSLLSRFLDTNNVGTGTKNAIGDYSGAVESFGIQPPNSLHYVLHRLIVTIRGPTTPGWSSAGYGNIAAGLTNGIQVLTYDAAGGAAGDLTDGLTITSNTDWARYCYDATYTDYGTGDGFLNVRWTFSKSGEPLVLSRGQSLTLTFNDDFTDLVEHYFLVQGYQF